MSVTDQRKLVLVFMVSILMWILAFRAIGQDAGTGLHLSFDSITLGSCLHVDTCRVRLDSTAHWNYRVFVKGSLITNAVLIDPPPCLPTQPRLSGIENSVIGRYSKQRYLYADNGSVYAVPVGGQDPVFTRKPLFRALWQSVITYRPYGDRRILNFSVSLLSGISWGTHEAVYADRFILEKRFGFSPYSWGGSEAWQSKYPGGRHSDGARPVLWKDKTNIVREAKKTTAYLGRYPFYAVGISITANKKRHWLDYVVASGIYTLSSLATYNLIR